METNYLGYEVKDGVFIKDLSLEGEKERLNKPYGYLLKNINPYNVNARLTKLYEEQEKVSHLISSILEKIILKLHKMKNINITV